MSKSPLMRRRPQRSNSAMALILVLAILLIVTVLVVAVLTLAKSERSSASLTLQRSQAELLSDAAADMAMSTITDAIVEGSTQPTNTTDPNKSWATEPGRIWIFDIDRATGTITRKSKNLFSALPAADPNNIDLNAPSLAGKFPIAPPAPGKTAANMKVGWTNLQRDPAKAAAADNPIIGRIAYWVDDESCKVNINTADGSKKINPFRTPLTAAELTNQSGYFGFGTPSEISLAALTGLDATKAAVIADYPWLQEFNSAEEITRAKDATGTAVVTRSMFEALRFDITHFNSSPDLNFLGHPQIDLIAPPLAAQGANGRKNIQLGPYVQDQNQAGAVDYKGTQGMTMDHKYPQPSQLPLPGFLPAGKLFLNTFSDNGQHMVQTGASIPNDFYVGKTITSLLNGVSLSGNTFTWPKFEGAGSTGFAGKYTPRQLDSIALQILDTVGNNSFCDQFRPYAYPTIMTNGWLSNQPVMGVARTLKFTELVVDLTVNLGDPFGYGVDYPCLQIKLALEGYFPKGYKGMPQNDPYDGAVGQWYTYTGGLNLPSAVANYYDAPKIEPAVLPNPAYVAPPDSAYISNPSPMAGKIIANSKMGSMWMDQLLTVKDQNGNSAGVDLMGNSKSYDDPDQAKAAIYHKYNAYTAPDGTTRYKGSMTTLPSAATMAGVLQMYNFTGQANDRSPGCYTFSNNIYPANLYPTYPPSAGVPAITSVRLVGGLHYWLRFGANSGYILPVLYPLDSTIPELTGASLTPAVQAQLKESVIPIDITVPTLIPGNGRLLVRTADPLVSQFPLDWERIVNPAAGKVTMSTSPVYQKFGTTNLDPFFALTPSVVTNRPAAVDGDNTGFRATGGGDPLSVWLPNQDIRIPKQARVPSVGALFSVRTGLFPDYTVAALPMAQQHGVAFRGINMSPSTRSSQATEGGTSYPDWAMLDLFTVPFLPQKPYYMIKPADSSLSRLDGTPLAAAPAVRRLTYGGATIGKMNINNPEVPYPFSVTTAGVTQTPPKRNALKALFQGLTPSKTYNTSAFAAASVKDEPVYTTIDAALAGTIATGIATYQAANGPFFMAGQVANVPEVATYLYTGVAAPAVSRNDLVRDTIGAITTRSNVFSIWVVAQTVKKKASNTGYGTFEKGDKVTSEVRRRYLVERYIEAGKDGVPGNSVSPSMANTPNTYTVAKPAGDDVNASYQPALTYPLPYRWRVIAVDNVQL